MHSLPRACWACKRACLGSRSHYITVSSAVLRICCSTLPTYPTTLAVLTIQPLVLSPRTLASLGSCSIICFKAYLQQSHVPRLLTAIVRSKTSVSSVWQRGGLDSSASAAIPAKLQRTSRRLAPPHCTAFSTIASISVSLVTLHETKVAAASPCCWRIFSSTPLERRSAMTTRAPEFANLIAVAMPIPELPPVIIAMRPSRRSSVIVVSVVHPGEK
jgi:hypothetical protein